MMVSEACRGNMVGDSVIHDRGRSDQAEAGAGKVLAMGDYLEAADVLRAAATGNREINLMF